VFHLVLDQCRKPIEALAQINGRAVGENAHHEGRPIAAQPSPRNRATAVPTSDTSIR
jgi:hypothetical protein